jgi:hypothetical protein
MDMSEYKLTVEIIARSEADTWEAAKNEWTLETIYEVDEPGTCLCGHYPIIEFCVIQNRLNGGRAVVGNVCVNKFLGLGSNRIFDCVKRIRHDISKSMNEDTIEYAFRKGWINKWEYGFLFDTMRKRNMSGRQLDTRIKINRGFLARMDEKPKID